MESQKLGVAVRAKGHDVQLQAKDSFKGMGYFDLCFCFVLLFFLFQITLTIFCSILSITCKW